MDCFDLGRLGSRINTWWQRERKHCGIAIDSEPIQYQPYGYALCLLQWHNTVCVAFPGREPDTNQQHNPHAISTGVGRGINGLPSGPNSGRKHLAYGQHFACRIVFPFKILRAVGHGTYCQSLSEEPHRCGNPRRLSFLRFIWQQRRIAPRAKFLARQLQCQSKDSYLGKR